MPKDVNIHIKTHGGDESRREIDKTAQSAQQMGERIDKGGEKAAKGMGKARDSARSTGGVIRGLARNLSGFIAGYLGVTAVVHSAVRAARSEFQHLLDMADKASVKFRSMRDLMFLGGFARHYPNVHQEISQMTETARLPGTEGRVEVAEAWEMLVSKTANLPDEARMNLMSSALQFRRTTKSDLSTLLNLFIQIKKSDRQADPQAISNLIQQTKTEAGSTTEEMAVRLPEILGVGEAAGLAVPETAALYAVGTSRFQAAKATTGLRIMLGRLQGKQLTPEGEHIKSRLGLKKDMPVMEQLASLHRAYQEGRLKLPELQTLFGEEGGPLAAAIIQDFPGLVTSYRKIRSAYTGQEDMVAQAIEEVFAPGSREALEEEVRREKAETESLKDELDTRKGLGIGLYRERKYQHLRRLGVPHWAATAEAATGTFFKSIFGGDPLTAAAQEAAFESDELGSSSKQEQQLTNELFQWIEKTASPRQTNIQNGDIYITIEQGVGDYFSDRTPDLIE